MVTAVFRAGSRTRPTLKDRKIQARDGKVVKCSRRGVWQRGRSEHAMCGSETSLTGMEHRKL